MKKSELKDLIKEAILEVMGQSSHREKDMNNPEEKKEVELAKKIKKFSSELLSMHGQDDIKEVAPPKFPTSLHDKLLKKYKSEPWKAYATMWKIHNKK